MTRFNKLVTKLGKGPKAVHNPAALAAYIGRKKYGKTGFSKLAQKGHRGQGK